MKRVAIQGGLGAYHGIAAENYFAGEEVEIIPLSSSRKSILCPDFIRSTTS